MLDSETRIITLHLDADVCAQIDAKVADSSIYKSRAEFVRDAIKRSLGPSDAERHRLVPQKGSAEKIYDFEVKASPSADEVAMSAKKVKSLSSRALYLKLRQRKKALENKALESSGHIISDHKLGPKSKPYK